MIKAKIPANKIALVILQHETACPMQDLALEAQRAGYSVLIYFAKSHNNSIMALDFAYSANTTSIYAPSKEILLIPLLEASVPQLYENNINSAQCILSVANGDRTNVEISVQVSRPPSKELNAMKPYLDNLYYWFLGGQLSHSSG